MDIDEQCVLESVRRNDNSTWYLDSGVTHHVCKEATRMIDVNPYSSMAPLLVGDGTSAKIVATGNSKLI